MTFTLICLTFALGSLLLLLPTGETRFASFNINMGLTVSDDAHKLSEDMVRICAQETDLSMEELHKFRQNDFSTTTESTQCFAHCIYEQMGLIRDGVFVERDVLRTLADVSDPNYYFVDKECREIKSENKCETVYKIHQCRHQQRMNELKPKETDAQNIDNEAAQAQSLNNNGNMMQ